MKLLNGFFKFGVLLCIFTGIGAMGVYGATYILSAFDGPNPMLGTVLCIVVVCAIIISFGKNSGRGAERHRMFLNKSDAYERLLKHISQPLNSIENEKMVKRKLLLFGSSGVLKEYAVMCEARRNGGRDPDQLVRLVKAIRTDLGLLSIGLHRGVTSHLKIQ